GGGDGASVHGGRTRRLGVDGLARWRAGCGRHAGSAAGFARFVDEPGGAPGTGPCAPGARPRAIRARRSWFRRRLVVSELAERGRRLAYFLSWLGTSAIRSQRFRSDGARRSSRSVLA